MIRLICPNGDSCDVIHESMTAYKVRFFVVCLLVLLLTGVAAQVVESRTDPPQFNIVKPSTTGIPGEEVRLMRLDPKGNLWVGARFWFWGEVGLAMLSADQLQFDPLPGGGFDTGAWKVWSSVQHPIPSVYLHDMQFSADGTMWLGSDAGLTRFRPNATNPQDMWHTYTPANSPLLIDRVQSVAVDGAGNVWVANADINLSAGGLFKLNPATNQWAQMTIPAQGGSPQIPWAVRVGNNGNILVSMKTSAGFAEFNGGTWTIRSGAVAGLDDLLQDSQGNVWAASGDAGLWKWSGSAWQNWSTLGGTFTITGLGKDRDGVVYVSGWYGPVYKMINDTPVFFIDAQALPRSVIGLPNGDVYINNYGSTVQLGTVRHYNASGELLELLTTYNSGLPDYFIDRIKRDSAGNMWFACGEAGLTRMLGSDGAPTSATHWRNWGEHNRQSEPYPWAGNEPMYAVFEDTGGIFWMGGNGVGRWDSGTGQFTGFWNWQNSNIDVSGVMAIVKRNGTIWIGTGGSGVSWFDSATGQWNRVSLSPGVYNYSANNVKAMTVDTQNNLWVASEYGLRKFAPGDNTTFALYTTDNSPLPTDAILDIESDPGGGIWIGTTAGLVRFDGLNWFTYNQGNTGMPGTVVSDIARRPGDGLIAIANNQGSTYPYTGGVSTFDGGTWTHYTTANSPLPHWQVVAVEFDGNGNLWASPMSTGVVQIMIGNTTSRRAPFDFDGDGKTDIGIFRLSDGSWWYSQSSDNAFRVYSFGVSSDIIAPGDFTGDGKTDIAVWRPSNGEWFIRRSEDNSFYSFPFGAPGDVPVPSDFDGDGKTDVAVFRPSSGTWFILNSSGAGTSIVAFGLPEDKPVPADFDGDGKTDIAIFRPSDGSWWYLQSSNSQFKVFRFGLGTDKPVPGDYTGDGKADVAVFRPENGEWFFQRSEDNSYFSVPFGTNGDLPIPGDYDGDGRFDTAVFRPSSADWYVQRSTAGILITNFGTGGDRPIPNAFVP